MRVLVIPDVHLKPWMFDRADEIMKLGIAENAVCLMDIPDDWDQELNLNLYMETFDKAIMFQKEHPDTLWCYGNHDLSYVWLEYESGFSSLMIPTVNEKMKQLKKAMPDGSQMAYIHRVDNVLFMHGGLTHAFVKYYASDVDYNDTDAVIERINGLGHREMWDDASPLWLRPQCYSERMYRGNDILQVVGHTPMMQIDRLGNLLSCDTFSSYRTGDPIGTQEFLLIDTETWNHMGIR